MYHIGVESATAIHAGIPNAIATGATTNAIRIHLKTEEPIVINFNPRAHEGHDAKRS